MISFYVHILDKEAPEFDICAFNQTLDTRPGQPIAVAVWQSPFAVDNSGDIPDVTCDPQSGSEFTIGQTLVTCEAVDSSGNSNTCSFQINVNGTSSLICFVNPVCKENNHEI